MVFLEFRYEDKIQEWRLAGTAGDGPHLIWGGGTALACALPIFRKYFISSQVSTVLSTDLRGSDNCWCISGVHMMTGLKTIIWNFGWRYM